MAIHDGNSTAREAPLRSLEGVVIRNKYQLKRLLGSGAMGFVYEAEQIGLTRMVAVKIMRAALLDDKTYAERFTTAALEASRVNHPHAVAVFDFGVTKEGLPYIVMERLRGRSLRELLGEGGRLSAKQVVALGAQILSALDEAHANGVVHCDIKSDNVIVQDLSTGPFAKVLDFGVVKFIDRRRGAALQSEYTAPEVLAGATPTTASDVYSGGVLLYEMLTGRRPASPAVPPMERAPGCPKALNDVILKALERGPAQRFPDAGTFRQWLLASLDASGHWRVCTACGSPRGPSERFCARCGAPLGAGDSPPPVPLAPREPTERPSRPSSLTRATCRVVPHTASGLVGRSRELARVDLFLRGAERSRALVLVGPQGAGKASLVLEAARRVSPSAAFLAGPDPAGLGEPWYPVLAMVRAVLALPGHPTYDELVAAVARAGLPERDAPGLAEVFALEGPLAQGELNVRRREASVAARRALASAAHRHADCLLCFIDVSQYDAPSRRFLGALVEAFADHGPRLLFTAENEEDFLGGIPQLRVGPLDPAAVAEMVADMAGPRGADVIDQINRVTGGWPAGVEQFAAWLDEGHTAADAPAKAVDLLVERMSRLPATPRLLLQAVATVGQVAPRADVIAMLTGHNALQAALALLVRGGYLLVDGKDLVIPSLAMRETVLACTPADARRRLARAALDRKLGRSPELAATLAQAMDDDSLAATRFLEAGERAQRRFDDAAAARWYEQARQASRRQVLQGEADAVDAFIDASVALADALRSMGELQLAAACLAEAALPNLGQRHRAALARAHGRADLASGNPRSAARELRIAIGLAIRFGGTSFLCEAYRDLAQAWCDLGEVRQAIAELNEALDLVALTAEPSEVPDAAWMVGLQLAELEVRCGRTDNALAAAETALKYAEARNDLRGRGRVQAMIALIAEAMGDGRKAQRHRAAALEALRAIGDRRSTAELLIASARSTADLVVRKGEAAGQRMATDEDALRTARELALEVEWIEGAETAARREIP